MTTESRSLSHEIRWNCLECRASFVQKECATLYCQRCDPRGRRMPPRDKPTPVGKYGAPSEVLVRDPLLTSKGTSRVDLYSPCPALTASDEICRAHESPRRKRMMFLYLVWAALAVANVVNSHWAEAREAWGLVF